MFERDRALWRHMVAGVVAAFGAGIIDVISASFNEGQRVEAGEFSLAALYLFCLQLPLGAVLGLGFGLAFALFAKTPLADGIAGLFRHRRGFARDPDGFGIVIASGIGAGMFTVLVRFAAQHFATRYHNPAMAAWAMAAVTLGIGVATLVVAPVFRKPFRMLGRYLGPFASPSLVLLLALGALLSIGAYVLATTPAILTAYSPWLFAMAGGGVLLYLLVFVLSSGRAFRTGAISLAVISLGALVFVGLHYGRSNRVRSVVEHRSTFGRNLLRRYAAFTDRDGDGHSFAFGGQDCDDSRGDVYPGAPDEAGDGIDADCFDGDGGRDFSDFGHGAYGTRPGHLPPRPNILFITIDALRPDHIGCAGYERDTTPNIDALCRSGAHFTNAYAPSSRSLRSIPAMMTGQYPSQVQFGPEFLWPSVRPENHTLAEVLSRRGYRNSVTMGTDYFVRIDGFYQGFQRVNQSPQYVPPRTRAVDDALRQLEELHEQGRPFMLWAHLFNVHQPYLQDNVPSEFGDDDMGRYDMEIRLADHEVQRLIDELERLGISDRTVILIASDHGEAFGEHGTSGHSTTVYEEEIRAALIVKIPGVEGRTIEERVSTIDIMPTVLNLIEDTPVPAPMPARSLVPFITGEREPDPGRLIFSELMPDGLFPFDIKAMLRGEEKLIYWVRDGTYQLFDLPDDPGEQHDISDEQRARADESLGVLRAWIAQSSRPENSTDRFIRDNRLEEFPEDMVPLDANFTGRFRVAGYRILERNYRPGDRIHVDLFYEVEGETEEDYFFYLNLRGPQGVIIPPHFHGHHYPLEGRYKTFQWRPGERLRDPVEIVIPRQMPNTLTLDLDLTILKDRYPVPYEMRSGETGHTMDLGQIEISVRR